MSAVSTVGALGATYASSPTRIAVSDPATFGTSASL